MAWVKIVQYVLSLVHIVLQVMFFVQWNDKFGAIVKQAKIDPVSIGSANLDLTQMSFHQLFLALLTLALYISFSFVLSQMATEGKAESKKAE